MQKNQALTYQIWIQWGLFLFSVCFSHAQSITEAPPYYRVDPASIAYERPENTLFQQSITQLNQKNNNQHVSNFRQYGLLNFKYEHLHDSLQSDITLNGITDSHDVFLYSSHWSQLASSLPQPSEMIWQTFNGNWRLDNLVSGDSRNESRAVSLQSLPNPFLASISIQYKQGRSAGFILWADSSGQTGYVIRYDSTRQSLILSRIGPRLEEQRFDTFPLTILPENEISIQVHTSLYTIQAYLSNDLSRPVLEAANITPMGNHTGWYLYDAQAEFQLHSLEHSNVPPPNLFIPEEGEYQHIFDQSVGESEPWYINDHCFIEDQTGNWHLFGTSNTASPLIPLDEDQFSHATASQFTQSPWQKQSLALLTDTSLGESQLWAPHVIFKDQMYYMFYCAGSQFSSLEYRIHLATSPDLSNWTRHDANPLFQDFFDARDPMIFQDGDQYIMYYTANSDYPTGNHITAYRTSEDLINWSTRKTAFTHATQGTFGGPTESPYVVKYEDHYYLFIGPENLNTTPDADYRRTAIYRSANPFHWDRFDRISSVRSHAAEVIHDRDGSWYVSHCGWFYNGVFIAPLVWNTPKKIQLFVNLGESLEYVTDHFFAIISDWRGTGGLDLVADFGSFFELELPVNSTEGEITIEFEEEGETLLKINTTGGFQTLLDEGNTGPASPTIHKITIQPNQLSGSNLTLRFSDSDPSDGWGPNVNWIRLVY